MEPRQPSIQKQLAHIEELIKALDSRPDSPASTQARELVQTLLEIHGAGFEQSLEIIHDSPGGQELIDRLAENPLVSNLLILHNLHPLDLETRVRRALDSVKPRLGLHGGDVQLLGVTSDGVVTLRLEGNCHGCPSSRVTLKSSIEEAIYVAAPDVIAIAVEGAVDDGSIAVGFVPKFTECPEPTAIGEAISAGVNA
jgi:Fe-S cluster biogenesis protein NfuA